MRPSAQGAPHSGTNVHKNTPTISTTFSNPHAQDLEGLSFHFWDLEEDRREGFL